MSLAVAADPSPIRVDSDGAVRVGSTRVRLASIVYRHRQGDTPEEIHETFPGVPLADVYAAIAFYLRHQSEVDAYLAELDGEAKDIRRRVEADYGLPEEVRQRLRARLGERHGTS